MRAITIQQPWALFVCLGLKTYETRTWKCHKHGPLLIHAGNTWSQRNKDVWKIFKSYWPRLNEYKIELGAIIGQVDMVACPTTDYVRSQIFTFESMAGDFGPNRYAWFLKNACLFSYPISFKGKQGFFDVPISPRKEFEIKRLSEIERQVIFQDSTPWPDLEDGTYSKALAIRLMHQGLKFSHRYFSDDEFIKAKNKFEFVLSGKYVVSQEEFWRYRTGDGWNSGWELLPEPKESQQEDLRIPVGNTGLKLGSRVPDSDLPF